MKSSLWSFANIASTVCVSDDASCEKIRLSLEECDVEKDISSFIKECGTGQEIPDPPKYIDFCRGDINDNASESSHNEEEYSVAQFQRTINPAFRTSSPQPSLRDSHYVAHTGLPDSANQDMARPMDHHQTQPPHLREASHSHARQPQPAMPPDFPQVPYNEHPMDGMTQFCRLGPQSDRSSNTSPKRPSSRGSHSDYSNPTSFSSFGPSSGAPSPTKQHAGSQLSRSQAVAESSTIEKKTSGFFRATAPSDANLKRSSPFTLNHPPHSQHRQLATSEIPPCGLLLRRM